MKITDIKTPLGKIKDVISLGEWSSVKNSEGEMLLTCTDGDRCGVVIFVKKNVNNDEEFIDPGFELLFGGLYNIHMRKDGKVCVYEPNLTQKWVDDHPEEMRVTVKENINNTKIRIHGKLF